MFNFISVILVYASSFYVSPGMMNDIIISLPRFMIQSTDAFPLNFGFTGKGNTSRTSGESCELEEQIRAGAIGSVFL